LGHLDKVEKETGRKKILFNSTHREERERERERERHRHRERKRQTVRHV
jgi:hypothetical protein